MSGYFTNKRSVTLVLIGNEKEEKRKTNLIVLLHAILSGKTLGEFASKSYSPPTPDKSSGLSRYRAKAKNGAVIEILDAPMLDASGTQATKITKAVTSLPSFDALVVVLDHSKPKLDSDVEHLLNQLFEAFPRSIHKNIVFLFAHPDKKIGARDIELAGRPAWVDKKQVVPKPIGDLVKIRNDILSDSSSTDEDLQDELKNPFNNSIARLKPLWEYIDSSSVQICGIKDLYLQAADLESHIYQLLVDNPTLAGDKAMNRITMLVNEYQAVSASPDFVTHIEFVTELLRTGPKNSGMKANIDKLEQAHARLKATENGSDKYARWFMIEAS